MKYSRATRILGHFALLPVRKLAKVQLSTDPVVVRANTKARANVTIASIGNILQSTAEQMDRESDILFLILTSHGSQDGVAVEAGKRSEVLSRSTSHTC